MTGSNTSEPLDATSSRLLEATEEMAALIQGNLQSAFLNLETFATDAGRPDLAERFANVQERYSERWGAYMERHGGSFPDKSDPVRHVEWMKGQQAIFGDTIKEMTDVIRSAPAFRQALIDSAREGKPNASNAVEAGRSAAGANVQLKEALEVLDDGLVSSGYVRDASLKNPAGGVNRTDAPGIGANNNHWAIPLTGSFAMASDPSSGNLAEYRESIANRGINAYELLGKYDDEIPRDSYRDMADFSEQHPELAEAIDNRVDQVFSMTERLYGNLRNTAEQQGRADLVERIDNVYRRAGERIDGMAQYDNPELALGSTQHFSKVSRDMHSDLVEIRKEMLPLIRAGDERTRMEIAVDAVGISNGLKSLDRMTAKAVDLMEQAGFYREASIAPEAPDRQTGWSPAKAPQTFEI